MLWFPVLIQDGEKYWPWKQNVYLNGELEYHRGLSSVFCFLIWNDLGLEVAIISIACIFAADSKLFKAISSMQDTATLQINVTK